MANLRRSVIWVLYALYATQHGQSTYRGIQRAMGLRTENAARTAVRFARAEELVTVIGNKGGAHCQAIVRLTGKGRQLLKDMQLRRDREDGRAQPS